MPDRTVPRWRQDGSFLGRWGGAEAIQQGGLRGQVLACAGLPRVETFLEERAQRLAGDRELGRPVGAVPIDPHDAHGLLVARVETEVALVLAERPQAAEHRRTLRGHSDIRETASP